MNKHVLPAVTKKLRACKFCVEAGKTGAQFHLLIKGKEVEGQFHRYCAEKLAASAPEGATVEVVHFGELRRRKAETAKKADEASTRKFWEGEFSQARARAKPKLVA